MAGQWLERAVFLGTKTARASIRSVAMQKSRAADETNGTTVSGHKPSCRDL